MGCTICLRSIIRSIRRAIRRVESAPLAPDRLRKRSFAISNVVASCNTAIDVNQKQTKFSTRVEVSMDTFDARPRDCSPILQIVSTVPFNLGKGSQDRMSYCLDSVEDIQQDLDGHARYGICKREKCLQALHSFIFLSYLLFARAIPYMYE